MKTYEKNICLCVWLGFLLAGCTTNISRNDSADSGKTVDNAVTNDSIMNMKINSSAFAPNSEIPSKYTCDGANINPPLDFSDVPIEAKSLVLILDDPDAPGGTWLHWTVYDISPDTRAIAENKTPAGALQGVTSFGESGYGGPCPPSGTHHYHFKLYALDTLSDLKADASLGEIKKALDGHIITEAELIALYARK